MAEINVRVNPSQLKTKAGEISGLVSNIKTDYQNLKNIANATKGFWTGEAAERFRSYVQSIDPDMQRVLNRLSEHPDDLLQMAGLYEQNEQDIVATAAKLPVNVIQ